MVMRSFVVFAMLVPLGACGAKQTPKGGEGSGDPVGVVEDTRSPLEKRRDTACDALAPRLTQCAVDDAKADQASGKISKAELDKDTAPDILRKNTAEAKKACKVALSSRQVRVLEVCMKEESVCGPLQDCLGHINDGGAK